MTSAAAIVARRNGDLVLSGPIGCLGAYLERVNRFTRLTRGQEVMLARRLRDSGDLDAARQLVLSHLRFVVRIAHNYRGYGLPVADLIQEGTVGLMKAVRRFDPEVGVRLLSFAMHWIRAEIYEYILRHWRLVKIGTTKAERKLFFNLRKFKKKLGWLTQEETRTLAGDLGVSVDHVKGMEQRLTSRDLSFDPPPGADEEEGGYSPCAYLSNPESDPAAIVEREQWNRNVAQRVERAMTTLDERSREILHSRWNSHSKATLHQLADRYGVSAERIRQLEANAIAKLRTTIAASA